MTSLTDRLRATGLEACVKYADEDNHCRMYDECAFVPAEASNAALTDLLAEI